MAQRHQPDDDRTLLAGGVGASILSSVGAGSYLFQFMGARDGGRLACTCVEARDCVAGYSGGVVSCFAVAGLVKTVAGIDGQAGAEDGVGPAARFYGAYGVAVNAAGTVYIADRYNSTIRQMAPDGRVTTFAGREHGRVVRGVLAVADVARPHQFATHDFRQHDLADLVALAKHGKLHPVAVPANNVGPLEPDNLADT
jgi:hypothetical protein